MPGSESPAGKEKRRHEARPGEGPPGQDDEWCEASQFQLIQRLEERLIAAKS